MDLIKVAAGYEPNFGRKRFVGYAQQGKLYTNYPRIFFEAEDARKMARLQNRFEGLKASFDGKTYRLEVEGEDPFEWTETAIEYGNRRIPCWDVGYGLIQWDVYEEIEEGKRVRINGTGTFWDGKEGTIVGRHGDGSASVAVKFGDGNETLQDFDAEYFESINESGDNHGAKEEAVYQVMIMHQDYSETLHFIAAKSTKQLEYKIGKIDPYYIDYSIVSKTSNSISGLTESAKPEYNPLAEKPKGKKGRNEAMETITDEERRKALADYLGIDVEDVEVAGGGEFDTPEGDYLVLTEDEAYDRAWEDIQGTIDDLGLGAFTENFRDYILNNLLDDYHIKEEVIVKDYEDYVEEIEQESSDKFENRLIEELYENGFLHDGDFEDGEDGKDYYRLKPSVDLEDKKYDYAKWLAEDVIVSDWLYDTFGGDEGAMDRWLDENGYIDWDEVKKQCIRADGVAHFISYYDGKEIELEGDLYAYRIN